MNYLVVDGMNFLHRARSGFQQGPGNVIFNFMRNLRALVGQFEPDKVFFVLEGHPQQRRDIYTEYKANRVVKDDKKQQELQVFFDQVTIIIEMLQKYFPVTVLRHPHYECDDTIYNVIKREESTTIQWIVASNDSDFTQLLNEFPNVRVYNPMKKTFVEHPDYDYVMWKALRGDKSDNIPGIPGVSDKKAENYLSDPEGLINLFSDPDTAKIFERNMELIKFITWSDSDASELVSSTSTNDWIPLQKLFETYKFESMLKPETWQKFITTFDNLRHE